MKKRLQTIISCIFALCLLQGLFLFAAGAPKPEYTMTASDYGEFCDMLSTLTRSGGSEKSAQAPADSSGGDYTSKRVIVKTDGMKTVPPGFDEVCSIKGPDGLYIFQFGSERDAEKCVNTLSGKSGIRYAVPDTKVRLCEQEEKSETEQGGYSAGTHLSWGADYIEIDLYSEWVTKTVSSSETVTVAVVDSGIAYHDLLNPVVTADGMDFVDSDPRNDVHGHGTHVAGIIADCTRGQNVKLMPVRVLGADGTGYTSSVVAGIGYAVSMGADVINFSIDGTHDKSKDDAVNSAVENGVIFVCAAGNLGDSIDKYHYCPAHNENAIVVGSINKSGKKSSFSNFGSTVDVAAPGNEIVSCGLNNDTISKNGTSMATAFITSIAAIYKIHNPAARAEDADAFIKEYSFDPGNDGSDVNYGHGVPKLSGFYYKDIFSWRSNTDGIEITGIIDDGLCGTVPYSIGGRCVTGIGASAFRNSGTLHRVSLPEGLKYIGTGAFFGCSSIEEINIPDSVTSVGDYAFFGCDSLSRLRLGAVTSSLGAFCAGFTGSVSEPSPVDGFVLEGYSGTAAESYAGENGLLFEESQKLQITSDSGRIYTEQGRKIVPIFRIYPPSLSGLCDISFSSSDISVVFPSPGNMLKAVAPGNAEIKITASHNGDASSCVIHVTVVEKALEIAGGSVAMRYKEAKTLTAGFNIPGYSRDDIVWSSDNEDVARVSENGVVTGAGRGTATVRATTNDGLYSAECTVKVSYSPLQWIIIILLFGWIWYI